MPATRTVNTFTNVTQAAKAAAREERLILATAKQEEKIHSENASFASRSGEIAQDIARFEKEAAIAEYAASESTPQNPEHEDLQKEAAEVRAETNERKAELSKELDALTLAHDKVVAEHTQKIADLQDGKLPVDFEKMNERAKELIAKTIEGQYLNGDFDGIADA